MKTTLKLAVALVMLATGAQAMVSTAAAQEALTPADGAAVGSRPVFIFAGVGPPGSATIEVSRSPDVVTTGDRAGAFIDPVDSEIEFFGDDPTLPANAALWRTRRPCVAASTSGRRGSSSMTRARPIGPRCGGSLSSTSLRHSAA